MCDIVLGAVDADCCILNSGSFRSNTLHPPGIFRCRDLRAILPNPTEILVIAVTGIITFNIKIYYYKVLIKYSFKLT